MFAAACAYNSGSGGKRDLQKIGANTMSQHIKTLNGAGEVGVVYDRGLIVLRMQVCGGSVRGISVDPRMLEQLARKDIVHTSSLPLVRTRSYGYNDVVVLMIEGHIAVVKTDDLARAAHIRL